MFGFRSDIDYQPKKRAKTAKIDNFPTELRAVVSKKVFNKKTSKFTQWQYKNYASDVLEYMCEILQTEVVSKELIQNGQIKLAWEMVYNVLIDMLDCLNGKHDRRTHILEIGWGYFQCNRSLVKLDKVLLDIMAATKASPDRLKPDIDFIKYAELLEMFFRLEAYGYYKDEDLKVIAEVAAELRLLAAGGGDTDTNTAITPALPSDPASCSGAVPAGAQQTGGIAVSSEVKPPETEVPAEPDVRGAVTLFDLTADDKKAADIVTPAANKRQKITSFFSKSA